MMKFPGICVFIAFISIQINTAFAQAQPQKGAREAAVSDGKFIADNIEDNEGIVFLSRKGKERGQDEKVKEMADQLAADHLSILYEFEQLNVAGGHANQKTTSTEGKKQTSEAYAKLSGLSGEDFDTLWVSSLLAIQQYKYDELTLAKDGAYNLQLKAVVTRAIPILRKHITQLKSLHRYLVKAAIQRRKEAERASRERQ